MVINRLFLAIVFLFLTLNSTALLAQTHQNILNPTSSRFFVCELLIDSEVANYGVEKVPNRIPSGKFVEVGTNEKIDLIIRKTNSTKPFEAWNFWENVESVDIICTLEGVTYYNDKNIISFVNYEDAGEGAIFPIKVLNGDTDEPSLISENVRSKITLSNINTLSAEIVVHWRASVSISESNNESHPDSKFTVNIRHYGTILLVDLTGFSFASWQNLFSGLQYTTLSYTSTIDVNLKSGKNEAFILTTPVLRVGSRDPICRNFEGQLALWQDNEGKNIGYGFGIGLLRSDVFSGSGKQGADIKMICLGAFLNDSNKFNAFYVGFSIPEMMKMLFDLSKPKL